ncbi:MAG: AraC family transcriptional regulator ligand-binding domain-containing protein [Alcanivoracaceae bacterium]|nr:AraC family transcriptional regulator ligand-binding domain-containing protein [Alcanivoracaceae bacterium]
MSKHSILGMVYMLQGFRALGEDMDSVLARFGMDLDSIDPGAEIDRGLEMRILTEAALRIRDPLAGLKVGQHFALAGYGPFIMLLMTCDNAYQAVQVGIRYQDLTFLFGRLGFEPGDHCSALVLTPPALPAAVRRVRIDGEVSGTVKLLRDMQAGLGTNIGPQRLEMPYPVPLEAAAYEEHFGCPVSFASDRARIWIPNEYLAIRMPTADPVAHRMYLAQCDALLQSRSQNGDGLAERVRAHLSLFSDYFPAAHEVAATLGISERTLRRQLSVDQTSFRQLLDEVLAEKAKKLLGGGTLSVDAVARRLGYAEPASFIRAFQRWTGTTPAAYRRNNQGR